MVKVFYIVEIVIGIFFLSNRKLIMKYYENFASKNNIKIGGKNKELIPIVFGLILIIKGIIGIISSY